MNNFGKEKTLEQKTRKREKEKEKKEREKERDTLFILDKAG